jgi:hypothetical protein
MIASTLTSYQKRQTRQREDEQELEERNQGDQCHCSSCTGLYTGPVFRQAKAASDHKNLLDCCMFALAIHWQDEADCFYSNSSVRSALSKCNLPLQIPCAACHVTKARRRVRNGTLPTSVLRS